MLLDHQESDVEMIEALRKEKAISECEDASAPKRSRTTTSGLGVPTLAGAPVEPRQEQ